MPQSCSALLTEEEQEWGAGAGCVDPENVHSGWVQLKVPCDKRVVLWMAELLWLHLFVWLGISRRRCRRSLLAHSCYHIQGARAVCAATCTSPQCPTSEPVSQRILALPIPQGNLILSKMLCALRDLWVLRSQDLVLLFLAWPGPSCLMHWLCWNGMNSHFCTSTRGAVS